MTGSAKQSISPSKERMDCFVASLLLRFLQTQFRDPPRNAPEVFKIFSPKKQGAGKAGCAVHPQPVCNGSRHTVVTTGTPEHPAFPAQGNLLFDFA
jgi:hypothetical protein